MRPKGYHPSDGGRGEAVGVRAIGWRMWWRVDRGGCAKLVDSRNTSAAFLSGALCRVADDDHFDVWLFAAFPLLF